MSQNCLPSLIINFSFNPCVSYSEIVGGMWSECGLLLTCEDFRALLGSQQLFCGCPCPDNGRSEIKSHQIRRGKGAISLCFSGDLSRLCVTSLAAVYKKKWDKRAQEKKAVCALEGHRFAAGSLNWGLVLVGSCDPATLCGNSSRTRALGGTPFRWTLEGLRHRGALLVSLKARR